MSIFLIQKICVHLRPKWDFLHYQGRIAAKGISEEQARMNSGNIESDVSAEKIGKAILSLVKKLEDAVAIGMCGSLARGDFHERSDINIFVIVKERLVDDRIWWDRRSDVLQDF